MTPSVCLTQDPAPGTHMLRFRGDVLSVSLTLSRPEKGGAWIRTGLGNARVAREEIVGEILHEVPPLGGDWIDIPMRKVSETRFRITLPLFEVGHFELKCFFLPEGGPQPLWPEGHNTAINVSPAHTCCANIVYNAFVRQFGPNKCGGAFSDPEKERCIRSLEKDGYAVIPPSGTFRDLIAELDFIIGELGCRYIQLLPIHPTPTTYGRMGRFGSPYAALSFTAVDPALTQFDPKATPMEQLIELLDAVHRRNAKLLLDIAINHTGWAASLHETHPEWLVRDSQGRIEMPGAWGVIWEDLTRLDYSRKDLWRYMADVFLTWCRRGVDGFRCDAAYMIPVAAWKYITAAVRTQYPDTVFFLEGLGGKVSVTRELLNRCTFDWAYSELFQNYDRAQIESYLPEALSISGAEGIMVHFAETHDNLRLACRSKAWARMRTAICALFSNCGGFGFANGVEWFAEEKIDVHRAASLNWGSPQNQIGHIRKLTTLLKTHPAFFSGTDAKLIQKGPGNQVVMVRRHEESGKRLLILANLDDAHGGFGCWDPRESGISETRYVDLLSEREKIAEPADGLYRFPLEPGEVLCLSADREDLRMLRSTGVSGKDRITRQRLRAKALEVFHHFRGMTDLEGFDPDRAADELAADPVEFCRRLNPETDESHVVQWIWPRDGRREVMVPPGHFLLVRAQSPFRARITGAGGTRAVDDSLPAPDGSFLVLFSPLAPPREHTGCRLKLSLFEAEGTRHETAPLLFLSSGEIARVRRIFHRPELLKIPLLFLGTNGRGGMARAHAAWGKLTSRYDALLGANLNPDCPEDRRITLTRLRGWVVFQGFSQDVSIDSLDRFCFDYDSRAFWRFHIPAGQGEYIHLSAAASLEPGQNTVRIDFFRHPSGKQPARLSDDREIRLILRPDVEDRSFHETTKAYLGPERRFPEAVSAKPNGFIFAPYPDWRLEARISPGSFTREAEWQYMVYRSMEAERGLDPHSDLFSPGFFSAPLKGGDLCRLQVRAVRTGEAVKARSTGGVTGKTMEAAFEGPAEMSLHEAAGQMLHHYVVRRGNLKSVIAGYPWFLDWGRDSLIFVRGLIAAGRLQEASEILDQFGRFEHRGTIPNMILGENAGNRDTSDAPLWFVAACRDLARVPDASDFLDHPCGRRDIRSILLSIGRSYVAGTENGIRMDPDSGLIFSPAHFTWMDTNHPAGTPREGYPVEIQALWYAALCFLAEVDSRGHWKELSRRVRQAVTERFVLSEGYLSDCLFARPGVSASQAEADDALRPNQLFAVTLGAVDDPGIGRRILSACEELLVPGGMRSLADRPVRRPLPIYHHGSLLNDPKHPYRGRYLGEEDTGRKPAYHNGTAWTWLLPTFCEAWFSVYGKKARGSALAWLSSSARLVSQGCAGHIPEILDGDHPHAPRGCDAQAWGAGELVRVWRKITSS